MGNPILSACKEIQCNSVKRKPPTRTTHHHCLQPHRTFHDVTCKPTALTNTQIDVTYDAINNSYKHRDKGLFTPRI